MSTHGGSQGGYLSELTLLPDYELGVFISTNGPNTGVIRNMLTVFILDLLLGEEPWVGRDDVCSPEHAHIAVVPCSQLDASRNNREVLDCLPREMKLKVNDIRTKYPDGYECDMTSAHRERLESYEGRYSHVAYGNLTIFLNETTDTLNMAYGPVGKWELEFVNEEVAIARGYGIHWYWVHTVIFDDVGGMFTQIQTNFEPEAPPTFIRDE